MSGKALRINIECCRVPVFTWAISSERSARKQGITTQCEKNNVGAAEAPDRGGGVMVTSQVKAELSP